jgi:hypothetical protein
VKSSKHSQTSFWVQWTRMDASQLWYLDILHSGPKHEFFIFYLPRVCEMLWNTPKHHFWVRWTRMDASQILVPGNSAFRLEIRVLHFLHAEGLSNAPKHSRISFWVQWTRMDALQLWYPKIVHLGSNTSFASFTCRRLVKSSETHTNLILGPMN